MLNGLLLFLLLTVSSCFAQTASLKGSCVDSKIQRSDGVAINKGLPGSEFLSIVRRNAKDGRTLGTGGLFWKQDIFNCDGALISISDRRITLAFMTEDDPLLGFESELKDISSPTFLTQVVYLSPHEKGISVTSGTNQGCHFNFNGFPGFTEGWVDNIVGIQCDVRIKYTDGSLLDGAVNFKVSRPTAIVLAPPAP